VSAILDRQWGYIDKQAPVIKPQFDFAGLFSEGLAGVGIGSKVGYIDKHGNFVITPPFAIANLFSFSEGLAAVRVGEFLTGKWGYIDKQGALVIKPQFDSVGPFSDGLAVAGIDDKWRYIDKQGKFVISTPFGSAGSFSEGLAAVRVGDEADPAKHSYIDSRGQTVLAPQSIRYPHSPMGWRPSASVTIRPANTAISGR
jgi:hypothetical protein